MDFNRHSDLADKHAFFSPSSPAWRRYDDEKIERKFIMHMAALRGTREHKFAQDAIELGMKMPKDNKTINMYINDCIGWRMSPEVTLYGTELCFGHADAIGFRDGILRISDYKSGVTRTHMDQLEIYDALFCMEYDYSPYDIKHELRIYQGRQIRLHEPDPEDIFFTMERIRSGTKVVTTLQSEAL
jgi:hypothetical protein